MRALAKRIRGRKAAAADLYDSLDEEPPWPGVAVEYTDETDALAARVRDALGITLRDQWQWRDRSGYQPLREWVDAIEALGVLVMQDGSLPVSDLRGFASSDPVVPAIVVNTNDDQRARAPSPRCTNSATCSGSRRADRPARRRNSGATTSRAPC